MYLIIAPPTPAAPDLVGAAPMAASRLPAPKSVSLTLLDHALSVKWSAVQGARRYGVVVFPAGVQGPQRARFVSGDRHYRKIKFSTLPTNGNGGFLVEVFAKSKTYGRSAYARIHIARFRHKAETVVHVDQDKRSTLRRGVDAIKDCAADGATTAIGTVVVGAPFVALSIPIPGIGEVTTSGLAAVAGIAGGSATVACFAGKALGALE